MMQSDVDTVVVPAREDTFQTIWLRENRWISIPIAADKLPHIKYIAVYQTYPHCAITSVAPVRSIEPWPAHPGKFVVNFAEPARKIGPIPLVRKSRKQLRGPHYTNYEGLIRALSLNDVFYPGVSLRIE